MKNRSSGITLILILTATISFAQSYEARWQKTPVMADGISSEWSSPLRFSDTKSGLQYAVTNDDKNLYICVKATGTATRMQILTSGMKIWIDANGRKKYPTSIYFPMPLSRGEMKPDNSGLQQGRPGGERPSGKPDEMDFRKMFKNQGLKITLAGFKTGCDGTFNIGESTQIKAAMDRDESNALTCEFIVPIGSFYSNDWNSFKEPPLIGMKISVDEMPGNGQGTQRPEGGPPGGGPGGFPNDMNGGPGGPPDGEMGDRPSPPSGTTGTSQEEISIKFKIRLSKPE